MGQAHDGRGGIGEPPVADTDLIRAVGLPNTDTARLHLDHIFAPAACDRKGVGLCNGGQIDGADALAVNIDVGDLPRRWPRLEPQAKDGGDKQ